MGNTAAQESSGPEGDVMGQDVFPVVRLSHACGHAERPVEEILSTPWPLYLVGVRSGESHWPHTHTHILPKYQLLHHVTRFACQQGNFTWNLPRYLAFTVLL